MSTRLYLKPGVTQEHEPEAEFTRGEKAYLRFTYSDFKDLDEIDASKMENVSYITIEESFWKETSGLTFTAGNYEGEGFEVTISPIHWSRRGSEKNGFNETKQDIFGRFDSVEIAKSFWKALTHGEILPTRPLCRELSLKEQAYAKQASLAVGLSTRISELEGTIAMLMNQLKAQGQYIQDHVLTPAK